MMELDDFTPHIEFPPEFTRKELEKLLSAHPQGKKLQRRLFKEGSLQQVYRGLFISSSLFQSRPWSLGRLASIIHEPCCVSRESALKIHGLIQQAVPGCSLVCPDRSRTIKTRLGTFDYQHLAEYRYNFGMHTIRYKDGSSWLLADPEKAVLDLVACQENLHSQKQIGFLLIDTWNIAVQSLIKLDPVRLRVYAQRYKKASLNKYLLPWLKRLREKNPL